MKFPSTPELEIFNNLDSVKQVNNLKEQIDELRPLEKYQEERIMQKLRLDWNYNSNAIEGNSLDYGETVALLLHGVTAKGKPLKDYLDIKGHNEAIDYLMYIVRNGEELSERDIRAMHSMLLVEPYETSSQTIEGITVQKKIRVGEYKRTPNHVKTITGEIHHYATPEDTPILMGELMTWYRESIANSVIHPVVIAAVFHHRFTSIHPFDDGNGRMSRLLMNLILFKYNYPPAVIKNADKNEYYLTLSQADVGDLEPFVEYISNNLLHSLDIYLKGAKGESVEEQSDLKKKLSLFKKEIEARRDRVEIKKSKEAVRDVYVRCLHPFFNSLGVVLNDFRELFFFSNEQSVKFSSHQNNKWFYQDIDIYEYLKSSFLEKEDIDVEVLAYQFIDFKLAEDSFAVELKVSLMFHDLSYSISYNFSEVHELNRINGRLYSQWMGNAALRKYYHQNVSADEIENITNRIGEDLYSFIRLLFDKERKVSIEIPNITTADLWNSFLEKHDQVPANVNEIIKQNSVVQFVPGDNVIKVGINAYAISTNQIDVIGLANSFYKFVSERVDTIQRVYVLIDPI